MATALLHGLCAPGRSAAVRIGTIYFRRAFWICAIAIALTPLPVRAQEPQAKAAGKAGEQKRITCQSPDGGRLHCAADTSSGVALLKSTGTAPCLLGKTWGYDDTGIWTSDGCGGEFLAGRPADGQAKDEKEKTPEYVPNIGFLLFDGEKGQIYFRLFSYATYLNQLGLDSTYIDGFANTRDVLRQQNVDLTKFFAPFSGWFLTPKFRYYLYVWSSNASQGDPAQVVGAGNLSYTFNRHLTLGFGITSLPSTRSTEGQFPYWLGVDDRLTADEFFRGSYTDGVWIKGELPHRLKYNAMVGNNLSILGVSIAQLDHRLNTQSVMLQWLPTTGEFGLYGTFGDYDDHQMVATRFAGHFTHSLEDRQEQPGTNSIENSQIRLTDGTIVFTPGLFGPGVAVNTVNYRMMSLDAGIKYHGMSLEGEYFRRWLNNFTFVGANTVTIPEIVDEGYQLQSSAMAIQKYLQVYLSGSQIFGRFGDASEARAGANWYFTGQRGLRANVEWIWLKKSPVGYTAVPYPVGGNGNVYRVTVEMNF
jgi:hypothetical protein